MGQYTNKGLYNAYKKNNTERAALDYYATPTKEVVNILDTLGYDFGGQTILEPCVGGGHMMEGIIQYLDSNNITMVDLTGTDVQNRGYQTDRAKLLYGEDMDFLSDDYPIESVDTIIMNPPYATLEPFFIRALEIAQKNLIVLCRTQAIEGDGRYKKIFADNPFTDMYQYVDRIQCWRNGVKPTGSSAQAYCWLVWDKEKEVDAPRLHWIHRVN